jgi:heme/copper-type cytochrome/quinol oxidase subunit 3
MTITPSSARLWPTLPDWPPHRLAVWAFLVNEGLLFGSLLAASLFLRFGGTAPWPRPGDALAIGPVLFATALLIASSATFNEAVDALRRGLPGVSRRWLSLTLVLACVFLTFQGYEWWELAQTARAVDPANPNVLLNNPWGAASFLQTFFLTTGLHGLHVLLGIALIVWLLAGRSGSREAALENVALYWHFVDFVWIFIVTTIYLL